MIRDLLKWVAPGLVTILGGTTLCLAMTSGALVEDLSRRSSATLRAAGADWAEISLDTRDLHVTGTTADPLQRDQLLARLNKLPGIRAVTADITLAPLAKPYQLQAAVSDGQVLLSGSVPDETTRQLLMDRAGVTASALELHAGMPDRRAWLAAALA